VTDLNQLKQIAKIASDEDGHPIVQIPLSAWESFLNEQSSATSQKQQIEALFQQWQHEPENDMPDEWWEEFVTFLDDNRLNFGERDLDLGSE
jgi:hypothetical protein